MSHANRSLRLERLESRLPRDASFEDLVVPFLHAETGSVHAAALEVAPLAQAEGESSPATRTANLDTNGDGDVSPIDALLIINALNRDGSGRVNGPDARPPLAPEAPEALQASGGETVTFDPALLVGGDLDPHGCDPVTITLPSQPTSGTASINAAGHIEYTAPIGTSEEVTVPYIVTNASGISAAGSFQVNILANTPPFAPDLTFTTEAGVPYTIEIPEIDPDQNTVTHTILTGSEHGTLEAQPDGTFLFTPAAGFVGTVAFTYRAYDGHVTSEGTVTVEVVGEPAPENHSPVDGEPNRQIDTTEGTSVEFDLDALDVDGDPLQYSVLYPTSETSDTDGEINLRSDGHVTFTPDLGFRGTTAFVIGVSDLEDRDGDGNFSVLSTTPFRIFVNVSPSAPSPEGESSPATRTANLDTNGDGDVSPIDALLVINALNRDGSGPVDGPDTRPPLAPEAPEALQASGGETVTFDPALLAGGDLDPHGCAPVTITLPSQPESGTATINAAGHIEYTAPIGTSGEVEVPYTVTNAAGISTAGFFKVNVITNTPPLAPDLTFTTEAGVPYTIEIPKIDLEQNTVTHTILTESEHGTLEAQPDGTFLFTPAAGFVGTVAFTYRAYDGHVTSEGTVTVEVVSGAEGESIIDNDLLDALVADQLGNHRSARDDVFAEFKEA